MLKTSSKGLAIFPPHIALRITKVMGLAGIHNPDALHYFNSMTFCLGVERKARMRDHSQPLVDDSL